MTEAATVTRKRVLSTMKVSFGRAAQLSIVPALVILGWWLLCICEVFPKVFLPPPQKVFLALVDWVLGSSILGTPPVEYSGTWLESAFASSQRVLAGYVVGCVVGISVGGLLGYFTWLRNIVEPFIHMLRAIPIIGWLPLSLVFFGLGVKSAIFLVALGTVFPVIVNTIAGVRGVQRSLLRVGQMMGSNAGQMLRFIVIPSAVPNIVTGLRVAMGFAWILVIVAEWMAVRRGLGYTLLDAYNFLRYDYVIASMISVGFMGFVFDRVIWVLFRPLLRWWAETTMGT